MENKNLNKPNYFDWKDDLKLWAIASPFLLLLAFIGQIESTNKYHEKYQRAMEFADRNKDRIVSLIEQEDLWRRIGYKGYFLEGQKPLKPSEYNLNLILESYEAKINQNENLGD